MPIIKPATLPRWGEAVGSQGVAGPTEAAPAAGKLDIGWNVGEKPPAQYQNWFQRIVYDWIQYLNDLTNQALTWVGQQQFNGNKLLHVGDPAAADDAATKNYIDATFVGAAHAWGADQAMGTHKITGLGDPGAAQDAATKNYIDVTFVAAAHTWGADQNLNTHKITNLGTPTAGTDAATKAYADSLNPSGNVQTGANTGSFTTTNAALQDAGTSVTITTTGRPVVLILEPTPGVQSPYMKMSAGIGNLQITRGAATCAVAAQIEGNTRHPVGLTALDPVAAGTYTYKLQVSADGVNTFTCFNYTLIAYEL